MPIEKVELREIDRDLQKLRQMLASGKEKKIDLLQFMQECTILFEKVEGCLREGDARIKEAVLRKLSELGGTLEDDIEELCKTSGKTEEEISAYIENPDNYTQDTWMAIQKVQRKFISAKKRKARKSID